MRSNGDCENHAQRAKRERHHGGAVEEASWRSKNKISYAQFQGNSRKANSTPRSNVQHVQEAMRNRAKCEMWRRQRNVKCGVDSDSVDRQGNNNQPPKGNYRKS